MGVGARQLETMPERAHSDSSLEQTNRTWVDGPAPRTVFRLTRTTQSNNPHPNFMQVRSPRLDVSCCGSPARRDGREAGQVLQRRGDARAAGTTDSDLEAEVASKDPKVMRESAHPHKSKRHPHPPHEIRTRASVIPILLTRSAQEQESSPSSSRDPHKSKSHPHPPHEIRTRASVIPILLTSTHHKHPSQALLTRSEPLLLLLTSIPGPPPSSTRKPAYPSPRR